MLQQTRVAAMEMRYVEFLRIFPDLASLAAASEEQVLAAWSGLGYYRRARNLHAAARQIVLHHGGNFPMQEAQALALPGIGPYTAAAILSIAGNQALPVLDGNVSRLLIRLHGCRRSSQATTPRLRALAALAMENRGPIAAGLHNQAMMELGALICRPGQPLCADCPLGDQCLLYQRGGAKLAARYPPPRRMQALDVELQLWLLRQGKEVWLLRDAAARFLADAWHLPGRWREVGTAWTQTSGLGEILKKSEAIERAPVLRFRHAITRHRLAVEVRMVEWNGHRSAPGEVGRWRRLGWEAARKIAVSSMTTRALDYFQRETEAESAGSGNARRRISNFNPHR